MIHMARGRWDEAGELLEQGAVADRAEAMQDYGTSVLTFVAMARLASCTAAISRRPSAS